LSLQNSKRIEGLSASTAGLATVQSFTERVRDAIPFGKGTEKEEEVKEVVAS
jgi:hypothetical protein